MRSYLIRLALVGIIGFSLTGCGSSVGTALPGGGGANGTGGGPTGVTNQNPPGAAGEGVMSKLIDCGTVAATSEYLGVLTTSTDTQSAAEAPTDAPTAGSDPNPADITCPAPDPGSHLITFNANGRAAISFKFTKTLPSLVYQSQVPGAILPMDYGAIIIHATYTAGAPTPATLSSTAPLYAELVGGSGSTLFDYRINCKPATFATGGFTRFICPLPAYGTASNGASSDGAIYPAATGLVTPSAASLFVGLQYATLTNAASTGNQLGIDNVYAEAGAE
jgi:hypothetical protein